MSRPLSHRQQTIIDCLGRQDACTYADLARLLQVSAMTVRREVNRLAADGRLIKTLRGARRVDAGQSLFETDLRSRLSANLGAKCAIAARAMERVQPGQTLYLDGSTTCLELAKALARQGDRLTLVTNSALLCLELGKGRANAVLCLGGQYDGDSLCFAGPDAEAALARLYFDIAFLSTKGFVPAEGTYESATHLFRLKQAAARHAREVVLLVDHSKFGCRALSRVLDTAAIHRVITDAATPAKHLRVLRRAGVAVDVAPTTPTPARRRRAPGKAAAV